MTWWLAALAGPTFLAVWVAGLIDLARRSDLGLRWRLGWAAAIVLITPLGAALYVLTRPVPVDRVVRGEGAEVEGPPAPPAGAPIGLRMLQQVARMASRGLFRSVEVVRPAAVATTGPQLWLASHFGAFSDPIVLLHALERRPRFLAKHTLWDIPVAGRILDAAGAIPVRRRHEGGGGAQRELFEACERALERGEALCVFPEGLATDRTSVAPLRSGAARIALGARARGVTGQQLIVTGIHFEDKAALRRRVFVEIGPPLDLDAWLAERGADPVAASEDRELVRALTDELEARLREAAPEFRDREEAAALHAAARIARVDDGGRPPTYAVEAALADELGRRPLGQRRALAEAMETYRAELDAAGLSDHDVVARPRRSRRRLALEVLLGLLLLPPALAGIVVHAPLWALVRGTGLLRIKPIAKASLRPLVAFLGALITWLTWAWILSAGAAGLERAGAVLTWLLVLPVWGAAALVVTERLWLVVGALRRRTGGRATDALAAVRADRARVVALVDGETADHG